MTFIDWSDPEGMFGLLCDFVADERADCGDDPERQRFLAALLARLAETEGELENSPAALLRGLRDAQESVVPEFAEDPVMAHVQDCIEEVERVGGAIPDRDAGRDKD